MDLPQKRPSPIMLPIKARMILPYIQADKNFRHVKLDSYGDKDYIDNNIIKIKYRVI